jgi:xylulokinase
MSFGSTLSFSEPTSGSKGGGVILSIDLGTSGPKVGLVDDCGRVIGGEFEPVRIFLLPGGGAEQDPRDWWQAIVEACRRLLDRQLVPPDEIIAVGCTGQWSGTVAVGADGQPLMNAIIWMDTRGAANVQRLVDGPLRVSGYALGKLLTWVRLTGGMPTGAGKDSIAHILLIKEEYPEIYRSTDKFLEPIDYLGFVLTGQYAASYDSIILHWLTDNRDIRHIKYDERLLSLSGIDRQKMPELRPPVSVLGELTPQAARELGLAQGVPVIIAAPDVHTAAVGAGAVEDYQAHLYIGTSSWMVCHLPDKKTNISLGVASLPAAIPDKYLVIAEQECAGICLNYLRDQIFFPEDELASGAKPQDAFALFDQIVSDVPAGSEGLIFTPWLYGERAPVEDPYVRGGFFNQTLKTSRRHMLRAVYEGVAYNSRWLLKSLEKFTRSKLEPIRMVGGGAKSAIWCQICADVFNRKVLQVKDPIQANMSGAAFLAYLALGRMKVEEISACVQIEREYHPDPQNRAIYDELFGEFVQLYKSLKPIYTRLNRWEGAL